VDSAVREVVPPGGVEKDRARGPGARVGPHVPAPRAAWSLRGAARRPPARSSRFRRRRRRGCASASKRGRDQATASAGRGSSCWQAREPPTGRRARRGATRLLPEAAPGGGGGAACAERALIPASMLAGPLRAGAHQRQRRRRVRRVEGALLHGRERQREKRAVRGAAALTVQPALLTGRLVFTNPHSGAGCAASACDHTSARGESSRRPEKRPCLPKRPTCKQLPHFCGRKRAPANPKPLAPGAPHAAAAAAAVRPDAYRSRGEHGHHASSGVGVRRHGRKLRAETRRSARAQLRQAAPRAGRARATTSSGSSRPAISCEHGLRTPARARCSRLGCARRRVRGWSARGVRSSRQARCRLPEAASETTGDVGTTRAAPPLERSTPAGRRAAATATAAA
jgi:hypothetical protein